MRLPDARKALKLALKAQEALETARQIAGPNNGDTAMLGAFQTASDGLERAIQRLCNIVPNAAILNPCGSCGRPRHGGACLTNRETYCIIHRSYFVGAHCPLCVIDGFVKGVVDRKTAATGEREL